MQTVRFAAMCILLAAATAGAQTAAEQRAITRDFERRVSTAIEGFDCASGQLGSIETFTLPISMVFRQLIATGFGLPYAPTMSAPRRVVPGRLNVCDPFPLDSSSALPEAVGAALPPLPASLEYRFVGHDLVLREVTRNVVFAVLPEAIHYSTRVTQDH
jgi:hypothetical protein